MCYLCVCMGFRWVFVYEKAYQVRDTAIESSVMTKVKGFGIYNDKVMDVADYVTPTQVWACHDLSYCEGLPLVPDPIPLRCPVLTCLMMV